MTDVLLILRNLHPFSYQPRCLTTKPQHAHILLTIIDSLKKKAPHFIQIINQTNLFPRSTALEKSSQSWPRQALLCMRAQFSISIGMPCWEPERGNENGSHYEIIPHNCSQFPPLVQSCDSTRRKTKRRRKWRSCLMAHLNISAVLRGRPKTWPFERLPLPPSPALLWAAAEVWGGV